MDKDKQNQPEEKPNKDLIPPKFLDVKSGKNNPTIKNEECEDENNDELLKHIFDED